jgi:hypothetical protein
MTMSGKLTQQDSCSWLIKAKCGAPGFTVHSETTASDEDVELLYVEYTQSEFTNLKLDQDGWLDSQTTIPDA